MQSGHEIEHLLALRFPALKDFGQLLDALVEYIGGGGFPLRQRKVSVKLLPEFLFPIILAQRVIDQVDSVVFEVVEEGKFRVPLIGAVQQQGMQRKAAIALKEKNRVFPHHKGGTEQPVGLQQTMGKRLKLTDVGQAILIVGRGTVGVLVAQRHSISLGLIEGLIEVLKGLGEPLRRPCELGATQFLVQFPSKKHPNSQRRGTKTL